uniref:PIN domain-containing protein n=1 Tax=Candidatus Kentrum sp. DK TaxID=2126562 RepID=A0A450TNA4_9GAMM|nr:MAG: hypothetical protein BECKDK2373B_GA0170837_12385 [Candidatus Kentron sp. DK]
MSVLKNLGNDMVVTAARQAITLEWWEEHRTRYEIFLSELVLEEIGSGDSSAAQKRLRIVENIPILETTGNAVGLSKLLIAEKAIPETSTEDALHIAIAAVQGMDFLLTWGFYNFVCNFLLFHRFQPVME